MTKANRRASVDHSRRSRSPIAVDPNRPAIERDLALGRPMAQIGRKYGYSSLQILNFRNRMSPQLRAAIAASVLKPEAQDLDKLRVSESEGILTTLAGQRARLLMMQDQAMEQDALDTANRVSRTIHTNVELTGRYLGQFAAHHVSTNVNVLISEDYLRVRQALTLALRPYAEARRAVAAELQRLEGQIAQRMLDKANGNAPEEHMVVIDQPPDVSNTHRPRSRRQRTALREDA